MGAWLTEELYLDHEVFVHDSRPRAHEILHQGEAPSGPLRARRASKPELFINCVTLGDTVAAFDSVLPHLPADCIISDISSVKAGLADFYKKESGHPFVSSHPMFGPTFGNIRDLQNESAVIIGESCERGKAFFRDFYSKPRHQASSRRASRTTTRRWPTPSPRPSPRRWSSPPA